MMDKLDLRIQAYLDGELGTDERRAFEISCEQDPELRAALHRARRVDAELARLAPPPDPAPDLGDRIMRAVRQQSAPQRTLAWWSVLVQPLRVPIWAAATVLLVLGTTTGWALWHAAAPRQPARGASLDTLTAQRADRPDARLEHAACSEPETVAVRFWVSAPAAQRVSLVGDFNDWEVGRNVAADPDANGVWTVTVPMRPGRHQYSFVIDGRWVNDPDAETYASDGYGGRNAVLTL